MRNWKKILRMLGMFLGVIAVLAGLAFVDRSNGRVEVTDVEVVVSGPDGIHFVDAAGIEREVLDLGGEVLGARLGEVRLAAIEDRLNAIPVVDHADVYHTLDGVVHVRVRQREPIARVLNKDGSGFYIDAGGWTFPTSDAHTARVLVFLGDIQEEGADRGVHQVNADDSLGALSLSDEIHHLASFIHADPFLDALVDQVLVNERREFELIPRVGGHRILIGDGSHLEERFAKLIEFYEKGMRQVDWRRYSRIDLRFTDQIVCTQRTTP